MRTTRPPVPWRDVVRFAVAIPAPLAVAVAVEGGIEPGPALSAGVFATMGALVGDLAPQPGPLRDRSAGRSPRPAFGVLGLLVGQYATGGGWLPVVVIALISAVAALISQVNATLSLGVAAAAGLHGARLRPGHPAVRWTAEVALLPRRRGVGHARPRSCRPATEALDPDRTAVADRLHPHRRPARRPSGTATAERARRALTTALNAAYDRVIRSRSHTAGRVKELSELAGVLNSAAPLVEGAVAAARAGAPAGPAGRRRRPRAGRGPAGRAASCPPTGPPPLDGRHPGPPRRPARRPAGVERRRRPGGARRRGRRPRPPVDLRTRLRELADRTLASPDGRAFAVRLALCMSIAEIARQYLPIAAALLGAADRRDRAQARLRVGVRPGGPARRRHAARRPASARRCWRCSPAAPGCSSRWPRSRPSCRGRAAANFGLFSVFQTPVIILMLDLSLPSDAGTGRASGSPTPSSAARSSSSSATCCGRRPGGRRSTRRCATPRSPSTPSSRPPSPAARPTAAAPAGATTARSPSCRPSCSAGWPSRRRSATAPPPGGRSSCSWNGRRTPSPRRSSPPREGEPAPDLAQVAVLRRAIRAAGGRRPRRTGVPDDAEIHADGVLAPVAREVDAARRLVRENAPGRRGGQP